MKSDAVKKGVDRAPHRSLFKAMGGGWEDREGMPYIDPETAEIMKTRTDWGDLIETGQEEQ